MKFVALVSGGKDSIFSILQATHLGHELVACVHLGRPREQDEEEESYMYQTAGSETLQILVEECLGVPLILHQRVGKSVNTSLVYGVETEQQSAESDEVEDLYKALKTAQQQFPNVQAVSSGAILSTYQRIRIEHVCSRLGLVSLSFLWRYDSQRNLLQRMIDAELEAVVVRVAAPPGLSARHLNQSLRQLQPVFHSLHDRYQFSVCGEGGEFETLVVDCPLYKKRLVLDETEVVETENDGVAELRVRSCHAELKNVVGEVGTQFSPTQTPPVGSPACDALPINDKPNAIIVKPLAKVCRARAGLLFVPEIMAETAACSSTKTEVELAVEEALTVFDTLSHVLHCQGATAQDVMMVNLYLSEMSHFAAINQHYRDFFGTMLPPSRSCIGVGRSSLPGGRRVLLDCIVQCGSGEYMRMPAGETVECENYYAKIAAANTISQLREVLHVQSISYWAPVCVGPYSQVNTFRGAIHFVAGQIGLVPETMTLHSTWQHQLEQAWKNTARILDAKKNCTLEHVLAGLVYITTSTFQQNNALQTLADICIAQMKTNGGIQPGIVDGNMPLPHDGYEDEDTMRECMNGIDSSIAARCPLLVIAVPELPVGASVEVEIVAATAAAVASLPLSTTSSTSFCRSQDKSVVRGDHWAGYDSTNGPCSASTDVYLEVFWSSLGSGVAGSALVVASVERSLEAKNLDLEYIFGMMIDQLSKASQSSRSIPDLSSTSHLRMFYVTSGQNGATTSDGMSERAAFQSAVSRCFGCTGQIPSTSSVPVEGLHHVRADTEKGRQENMTILFAIRASVVVDPVCLETELWICSNR